MELLVPPDAAGERLDTFLASPVGSRSQAARAIAAGLVLVDGEAARKGHPLRGGERIVVLEQAPAPADEPDPAAAVASFEVAYEDKHLIVVDKPAGVVVHPARGHRQGTLAQALAGRIAGGDEDWRAGIVHRLDRDTSGLLVVAKSDEVHRALKAALGARDIKREYLALVEGRPSARSGTIEAPIGRDRRVRTRVSTDTDVPKAAITHFEIDRTLAQSTLLRVRLQTGRTHQIRVHLEAIDLLISGDPVYGSGGDLGLERQFLHANRLSFDHPFSGERLELESPLPDDLAAALERARALT